MLDSRLSGVRRVIEDLEAEADMLFSVSHLCRRFMYCWVLFVAISIFGCCEYMVMSSA